MCIACLIPLCTCLAASCTASERSCTICVCSVFLQPHEFDNLRFDVSVTDCIYYLRCESATERQEWLAALQQAKVRDVLEHSLSSSFFKFFYGTL